MTLCVWRLAAKRLFVVGGWRKRTSLCLAAKGRTELRIDASGAQLRELSVANVRFAVALQNNKNKRRTASRNFLTSKNKLTSKQI